MANVAAKLAELVALEPCPATKPESRDNNAFGKELGARLSSIPKESGLQTKAYGTRPGSETLGYCPRNQMFVYCHRCQATMPT
jgi:hypothetical protein